MKNPRHIAGHCLTKSEHEKARGHEICREHIELNADPQHERNAKNAAEQDTRFSVRDQQTGGCEICQTVDDEQRAAGKGEISEQYRGKWQFLKVWQHTGHTRRAPGRIYKHHAGAQNRAYTDKQRPE